MEAFVTVLTIFALALFVGFEVISKVPATLHTPLMSGANSIHGIVLVGGMIIAAEAAMAELGFGSAMLWVLEDNARARAFYEAAGWRPDGGRQLERIVKQLSAIDALPDPDEARKRAQWQLVASLHSAI